MVFEMKKKTKMLLVAAVLLGVPLVVIGIVHFQMNVSFNKDRIEYLYSYADAYAEATEGIPGLDRLDAMEYMRINNIEEQIENLHKIIDERIISLKKWETKFNTVYMEPYFDIESIIALEYVYNLSKTGFYETVEIESEEWYFIGSMLGTVRIIAESSPKNRDEYRKFVDNNSIINGLFREKHTSRDYLDASLIWRRIIKSAGVFLNDPNIPNCSKTWVYNYIQRDPYNEQMRKLNKRVIPNNENKD
jgi:hypothetical protein